MISERYGDNMKVSSIDNDMGSIAINNAVIAQYAGSVTNGTAPSNAREIVALRRPLTEVLQPMMKESDNLCAEAVFYQISARSAQQLSGKHYSRRQSISAINDLISRANGEFPLPSLSEFAISSTVADGSGLSLYN